MAQLTAYDKFIQQALKYGFSLFGLPPTGQIIVYQAGDDGTYKKGYPRQGPRFVDNGDGTITDKGTGLMWAKDGNGAGCNGGANLVWGAAITWAEGLTFATYSDWRLPNMKEIQSLISYVTATPVIDPIFTNTVLDNYWSSTTYITDTNRAWRGNFSNGLVYNTAKSGANYVRAVRGG